ncbi:helix-turn-helix transcriptional regulator [Pseudomonas sp. NY15364]|jgi:DNA-binding XRE family transcriptional regulator|uniref:helix-turn-helix transcriptional regulator n=1 Tax=Pseudomonas sp. NY15364 TaxID=3400353 RepID=UPI003A8601C0
MKTMKMTQDSTTHLAMTGRYAFSEHTNSYLTSSDAGESIPAPAAKIYKLEISIPISKLAQCNTDFDSLLSEIESDPENEALLTESNKWISETFLGDEPLTLQKARLNAGYSQANLAKLMNTSQAQVSLIERGKCDPHFSTICKLCELLKITPNQIHEMLTNAQGSGEQA